MNPLLLAAVVVTGLFVIGKGMVGAKAAAPIGKPPGGAPPPGGSARDFVLQLPKNAGQAREQAILSAIQSGFMRSINWQAVDASKNGVSCTVFVSDDVVSVGTDSDNFIRVNTNMLTAQRIADGLGALLVTTRVSDLAWQQAATVLKPHTFKPDAQMASTARMLQHHDAIEKERGGRGGLVRTLGKDFVISNLLVGKPSRTCIYGWHTPQGGFTELAGVPHIQPITTGAHEATYTDYSHWVQLMRGECRVAGKMRRTADVLRDPDLAMLLSDEGALKLVRHPAVPEGVA